MDTKEEQLFKDHLVNIFEYINDNLEIEYHQNKLPSKIKILYFFEKINNSNIVELTLRYNFYEGGIVGKYSNCGIDDRAVNTSLEGILSQIIRSSVMSAEELRSYKDYSNNLQSIAVVNTLYNTFKYIYPIYQMVCEKGDEINNIKNILPFINTITVDDHKINNIFYQKELKDHMDLCLNNKVRFTEDSYSDVIEICHTEPINYLCLQKER